MKMLAGVTLRLPRTWSANQKIVCTFSALRRANFPTKPAPATATKKHCRYSAIARQRTVVVARSPATSTSTRNSHTPSGPTCRLRSHDTHLLNVNLVRGLKNGRGGDADRLPAPQKLDIDVKLFHDSPCPWRLRAPCRFGFVQHVSTENDWVAVCRRRKARTPITIGNPLQMRHKAEPGPRLSIRIVVSFSRRITRGRITERGTALGMHHIPNCRLGPPGG